MRERVCLYEHACESVNMRIRMCIYVRICVCVCAVNA